MAHKKRPFRNCSPEQLVFVIEGLRMLLDKRVNADDSVIQIRPIYNLKEEALDELDKRETEVSSAAVVAAMTGTQNKELVNFPDIPTGQTIVTRDTLVS